MTTDKILYAFYDEAVSPTSFDFISFVIQSEAARRKAHLDGVQFFIVPSGEFDGHHDNTQFDEAHARWRLSNVVVPICWLLPSCRGVSVCSTRQYASDSFKELGENIFPRGYTVETPIDRHHTGWTIIASTLGEDIYFVKAADQAKDYARQWIEQHAKGKKCIPITLREAPFGTQRNSDPAVWSAVAHQMLKDGYFPVLIRDIDRALEKLPPEYEGIPTFPEAAFNLELRIAFYEESHFCMFVANGPAQICFYDRDVKFLYQVTGDWLDRNPTPFLRMGIDHGESGPFANKFKRWIWQKQDAKRLYQEMLQLDADIDNSIAAGTYEADLEPDPANRISILDLADRFYDWCGRTYFTSIQEAELSQACWEIANPEGTNEKERLLRLANFTLATRDVNKAISILVSVCHKFGDDPEIFMRIAILHDSMDEFVTAIEYYQQVLKLKPNSMDIYFRLGVAYKNMGEIELSIEILEKLLGSGLVTQKLFLELGEIYENLGQPEKALEIYEKAEESELFDPDIMKRKKFLSNPAET
jgi:tetratricopeptide (TPR) repeat protein